MIISKYLECEHIDEQRKKYVEEKKDEAEEESKKKYGKLNASELRRIDGLTDSLKEEFNKEIKKQLKSEDLMEKDFNECTEDEREEIIEYKKQYYKSRFSKHEIGYLTRHYDRPKDIITYKMYADLIYRDEKENSFLFLTDKYFIIDCVKK